MIKWATQKDKARIFELWQLCFDDSFAWTNWYFEERFSPKRTLCLWQDGQIVSDLQLNPYPLKIRSTTISTLCVSGVATHPLWQRKGYMRQLLIEAMHIAEQQGYSCMFNMPQNNNIYSKYDHLYFTNKLCAEIKGRGKAGAVENYSLDKDFLPLLKCYCKFIKNYSGIVNRTPSLFKLRLKDTFADGGSVIYNKSKGKICGYCMYIPHKDYLECTELIYDSKQTLDLLINSLLQFANGKKLQLALPADAAPLLAEYKGKRQVCPGNVLRVLNAPLFLKQLNVNLPYNIGINDKFLACNNGVFTSLGETTHAQADIEINIGEFGQWLSGYYSLKALYAKGEVKINNSNAAIALDAAFPKCLCYSLEAY